MTWARRKIPYLYEVTEMLKEYSFVLDVNGTKLDPTILMPNSIELVDWTIKPMRRKSKAGVDEVCGFRHRDYVTYTYRNGETYTGYVTAMYPELHALNFQSPTKHCKKANALKCKLVWRYNKIYWFKCA